MHRGGGGVGARKHRAVCFHSIAPSHKYLHQECMRVNRQNDEYAAWEKMRRRAGLVYENASQAVAAHGRRRKP